MGATGIEWTKGPNGEPGFTFNPWIGCTKISGACDFCYAETSSKKFEEDEKPLWGPHADRRGVSELTWLAPYAWDRRAARAGQRFRVFTGSMCDFLDNHKSIDPAWRERHFRTMEETPNLDWLPLTKRPENARKFIPYTWFQKGGWPQNVAFGFTGEDQPHFDHRARHVRQIPAPMRFVSVEPMLGDLELPDDAILWLDWVICGGELGPLAKIRDTPIDDMEHLAWQCALLRDGDRIGIPFFMKQLPQISARADYKKFDQFPIALRVREQPTWRRAA